MRALWIGPGARRGAARAGSAARSRSRWRRGGYVRLGDRWLLLAPPRAPLGPLSLLVEGLGALEPGAAARVAPGALHVGGAWIDLRGRARRRRARGRRAAARGPGGSALAAARRSCPAPVGSRTASTRCGAAPWRRPSPCWRAAEPGLTPAGDDVLAGFAGWRHADGAPVSLAAPRGSPIGLAYLRCAERGELPEAAQRTLDAVRAGDAALAARRARVLARWGATSGGAMLCGMAAASGAT